MEIQVEENMITRAIVTCPFPDCSRSGEQTKLHMGIRWKNHIDVGHYVRHFEFVHVPRNVTPREPQADA